MARIISKICKLRRKVSKLLGIEDKIDQVKLLHGRTLSELQRSRSGGDLRDYEFSVFSQWGEDGIIQYLIRNIKIGKRTFIEFGVEDFQESNCRFLLMKDNWSGFVLDGSQKNIQNLQNSSMYWRHPLIAQASFITRDNVDSLLRNSGFSEDLGILSVDLDGVDYHVLEALSAWRPDILITEYNAVLGCDRAVTVPYDSAFIRSEKHFSNLYAGASLPAFVHLAGQRDYSLVGVNSAGNNAFFVRNALLNDVIREVSVQSVFRDAIFKESRNRNGTLSQLNGLDRRRQIADLPLLDVITGENLQVRDLGL